jgi:hypothetical protein
VISNSEGLSSEAVEQLIVASLISDKPLPSARTVAQPGSEAALRHLLDGIVAGAPDFASLTPPLAAVIRAQLPALQPMFDKLGAVQSVAFKGVDLNGEDQYLVRFATGALFFTMSLDASGKIGGARFVPLPPAKAP